MRYDIAIIGSGPAGLSAAVNAKIRNKSFIIFGNKSLSTKIEKAPSIDNYLGLYNISGANLKQHFMDHIESMDIQIDEHKNTYKFFHAPSPYILNYLQFIIII